MTSVLVVGSGGREHALAWKLGQSPDVDRLYVAPGNAGTRLCAENVPVPATDIPAIVRFVNERAINLTVVGPEAPLAMGLADALIASGRAVVGPSAAAARIESSKSFAKEVMQRSGVPTAAYRTFDDARDALDYLDRCDLVASPMVIKADGLAAGKGVAICSDGETAQATIRSFMLDGMHGQAGTRIVIEELLAGPEVSLLALVDGKRVVPLPLAQDHKRLGDGDTGPNTGGMGAYASVPFISEEECDALCDRIIAPVVETLAAMGTPFRGILFAGLMLTAEGPKVLEFNCRGGDPETQVILPLLADDLLPWLQMTAGGRLSGRLRTTGDCAVGVVLAAPGYPERPITGAPILGLEQPSTNPHIFHAGTSIDADGRILTAGGRVLTVVGIGKSFDEAAEAAYGSPVSFDGMQRRMDIGWQVRNSGDGDTRRGGRRATALRAGPPYGERRNAVRKLTPYSIAVLASGNGSNLEAISDAIDDGRLAARIAVVISHDPSAFALERARRRGIPAIALSYDEDVAGDLTRAARRQRLESALLEALAPFDLDLIVLAGWMRILSAGFLDRCRCPIINVHPALLDGVMDFPVLRGAHAVRDALRLGLPFTGASVHHVTPTVDGGPVILSRRVEVLPGDSEDMLHARIKRIEHEILPQAIQTILTSTIKGGNHARNQH